MDDPDGSTWGPNAKKATPKDPNSTREQKPATTGGAAKKKEEKERCVGTKGRRQANPRWKGPGAAEEEEPVSASEAAIGAPPATETKGTE